MRKLYFLICLIFLLNYTAYTQSQNIDTLKKELDYSKADTNNINFLDSISVLYFATNPDNAVSFLQKELLLSQQINYVKGEIRSLNLMGSVYRLTGQDLKAGHVWQKALDLSENAGDSSAIVLVLNNYGYIYSAQGDYKSELLLYQRAEKYHANLKASHCLIIHWFKKEMRLLNYIN